MLPGCSFMIDRAPARAEGGGADPGFEGHAGGEVEAVGVGDGDGGVGAVEGERVAVLACVAPAQVAFVRVPLLPVPDWSVALVPLPVSKP